MGPERGPHGLKQRALDTLKTAARTVTPCVVLPIAAWAARAEIVHVPISTPQLPTPKVLVLEKTEFPDKETTEKIGMTLGAGVVIWGVWVGGERSSDGSKNKFEKNSLKRGIPTLATLAIGTLVIAMWR